MNPHGVSAILVGDLHARDTQPVCRVDDFWSAQIAEFQWLWGLWNQCGKPPVLQAFDLFHSWRSQAQVISAVLKYLPPMITGAGNPGKHNASIFEKDPVYTVSLADKGWSVFIPDVDPVAEEGPWWSNDEFKVFTHPWGAPPMPLRSSKSHPRKVLLMHYMVTDGPGPMGGEEASRLIRKLRGYDLVVTGHNHQPIVAEDGTGDTHRWLVNPGSLNRQEADENHAPRVYLWRADDNSLEPVLIPQGTTQVSRDHIEAKENRDERLVAFVTNLENLDIDLSRSFKSNVRAYLATNNIRKLVENKIRQSTDL
jgi:hypothetical protein